MITNTAIQPTAPPLLAFFTSLQNFINNHTLIALMDW